MKELKISAAVDNIETVTDFVNGQLELLHCPVRRQMQIDVAIDEIFGNIARYAYSQGNGEAVVRVETQEDPLSVVISFIDSGKPFDPLKREDPDVTLSAEDRRIGGLGIFVVKKIMDAVHYRYENGKNILTIRKNLR